MHTTQINDTVFNHNGGYDGDVYIIKTTVGGQMTMVVPVSDFVEFVANYVRDHRIAQLEQASAEEILGL